jgi:hypothetical protein
MPLVEAGSSRLIMELLQGCRWLPLVVEVISSLGCVQTLLGAPIDEGLFSRSQVNPASEVGDFCSARGSANRYGS